MSRTERSEFKVGRIAGRGRIAFVCLAALTALLCGLAPAAIAQNGTTEFTLTTASFNPDAVAPGGVSSSLIQVGSVNGFSGTVNLSCQVSPSDSSITSPPTCAVSPASVTPPASATATVTTQSTTTTVAYTVAITGTGPTTTYTAPTLPLTVLAVTPQFTITVSQSVSPNSVPAGSGSTGVVTVNPINGYVSNPSDQNAGITLACASISPLVTIAPVCSFNPQGSQLKVLGNSVTSQLTISTFGPVITSAHTSKAFGLWVCLPLFGLVSIGAVTAGKRSRKAYVMLAMMILGGALLVVPGCGNTTPTATTPNGVTPANAYTFTIIGVDQDGVVSSNTSSSTSTGPTVSLTVN